MRAAILVALLALLVAPALAAPPTGQSISPSLSNIQQNPNDFPFPTMPWNGATRPGVRGQVLRYLEVPPQPVTIAVPVPTAETQPFELASQVVTIPGYVVTETTTGYIYPERWTLEQLNVGVYQWRLLPAGFRPK